MEFAARKIMKLSVEDPQIAEVLDLESGEHFSAEDIIGVEPDKVSQLRLSLRTLLEEDTPKYACSMCGVPVYLVCRGEDHLFHFRHTLEDGRCSAKTRGLLSQDEIDARKYNGAKESALHLRMKNWVADCLRLDPRFSDVQVEERWKGRLTGDWRKPDVRASYGSLPVAFEIQLSTTHLNVIAKRRLFYLKEGALLVWIFARFNEDNRRLTQDDVFYNNNQNAFVVNQRTVTASQEAGHFRLGCTWAEPLSSKATSPLRHELVSFHDLTLDPGRQQAFYFDFYGKRASLARSLRDSFEAFLLPYLRGDNDDLSSWRPLRKQFQAEGLTLPAYPQQLPTSLLFALYSAKHGRPAGCRLSKFIEVVHLSASAANRKHLRVFRAALIAYRRAEQIKEEDKTGKWRAKVLAYKAAIRRGDPDYAQSDVHDTLIRFLFPEIKF